jgi:hypothetical protein
MVMTLLTVMLATAFLLISAETRTTDSSFAASRALALAQAGQQAYFSTGHGIVGTYDSVHYTFTGGFARVIARRLHDSTTSRPQLWVIYTTGVDTTRAMGAQPNGLRTIAQLARLQTGSLPARAAIIAANGVRFLGSGDNPIDGSDAAFCWPQHDSTGLTAAVGGAVDSSPPPPAKPAPAGSPGLEILATEQAVLDSTHIDWVRLVDQGEFTPDYTATPPCTHSQQLSGFPSGFCNGNATLTGRRYGILVVTGNVDLASAAHWDGILIVGGRLTTPSGGSSTYTVHGMVITGLNMLKGQAVQANQLRRGTGRVIQWASCYTAPSVTGLAVFAPVQGTWFDNWALY